MKMSLSASYTDSIIDVCVGKAPPVTFAPMIKYISLKRIILIILKYSCAVFDVAKQCFANILCVIFNYLCFSKNAWSLRC